MANEMSKLYSQPISKFALCVSEQYYIFLGGEKANVWFMQQY